MSAVPYASECHANVFVTLRGAILKMIGMTTMIIKALAEKIGRIMIHLQAAVRDLNLVIHKQVIHLLSL